MLWEMDIHTSVAMGSVFLQTGTVRTVSGRGSGFTL